MKIVSLNSSDTFGGAARAAYRLHGALRRQGLDAQFMVQRKFSDDPTVLGPSGALGRGMGLARNILDQLPLALHPRRGPAPFSPALWPSGTVGRLNRLAPDLVHLHWICEGLASLGSLSRIAAPVVWTLHDSWPFTGGCHIPHDCTAYRQRCGSCPQLGSHCDNDLSRLIWSRKQRALRRLGPVLVTPSRWLAGCAASSSLAGGLRIETIPNGIDLDRFAPLEKVAAKRLLGVDPDKRLLLFSALDGVRHHHKGFHLLVQALAECVAGDPSFRDSHLLYVVGSAPPEKPPELPIPVRFAGKLQDDVSLALAYNAADLYLNPALLENLSTTVIEALACGTPSVAFDAGGMADIVVHGHNGYLAAPYDCGDFARGILWALADRKRLEMLSGNARASAEKGFGVELMARRYLTLYEDLWNRSRS